VVLQAKAVEVEVAWDAEVAERDGDAEVAEGAERDGDVGGAW
jgi:hypothetical protein